MLIVIQNFQCSWWQPQENNLVQKNYIEAYKELYVYSVYLQQTTFSPKQKDSLFILKLEQTCQKLNISKKELAQHYEKLTSNPDVAIPFYDSLISYLEKETNKN
ncbi:MAG: hypothetical protein RML72_11310 [Bacteroidia bacterium]|nr:hypothetical protein [Bacteroidia bacterium]MDW8159443.1 hypothetical protein [Bacteroidia bacterium]